ncbi:MAG: hypothetical protein HYS27_15875 [Deltaproteobacteria bacterium]|nr:hypothetical protein [Deltaproteobacteria bacterium]
MTHRRFSAPSLALAALIAAASSGGCFTMHADLPGTWRAPAASEPIEVVGRLDVTTSHTWLLGGLLAPPPSDLYRAAVLAKVEAAGGHGIANVVVDTRFTGIDVMLRAVTLGIVAPRTYRIRADIVRLSTPPPPGAPLLRREGARPAPAPPPAAAGAP